jgi:hypothetical protein
MRYLVFAVLAVFLAACTNQSAVNLGSVPPARNAVFATQLAGPGTYLHPMPTAIVLLKPEDMARNRAFCNAFMKLPTAQEEMAKSVIAPNLILTRWLIQLNDAPADRIRDCDYLVGTYDYNRANALAVSFQGVGGSLSGRGPFLVMVIPDSTGLHAVAVDGSRSEAADFDKFIGSWNEAVNRSQAQLAAQPPNQPGVVRSVFNLISAVLRTVFGGTAGLIQGTIGGL